MAARRTLLLFILVAFSGNVRAPGLPAASSGDGLGRSEALHLGAGNLVTRVGWTVDDSTSEDVLRGYVEYQPNRNAPACRRIRFIQVAKVEQNGGTDYQWGGQESPRNALRTRGTEPGVEEGFFVDHRAAACAPGRSCSPYFRDHWANPHESADGYTVPGASSAASLVDYPFGWQIIERIRLESCARCVDSGEFLGCADWGAKWPSVGSREILPVSFHRQPSPTFGAALHQFEEFYGERR